MDAAGVCRSPAGFDGRLTTVSPSINSQSLPKVGMDMVRLCRLDRHVILLKETKKVTGNREIAICNFRCVSGGLQMSTELSQAGMNLHEHLLGDFQGMPCPSGSDYAKQKSLRPTTKFPQTPFLRIIRSFT